jgi:hypothetical protein
LFDAVSLVSWPSHWLLQCVQHTPVQPFLLHGHVAGGGHVALSLQLLREPLLEIVRQQDEMVCELRQTVRQQDEMVCELRQSVRQQDEIVRQQDAFVSELRVTNTYLRNSACLQFKYTSSQATQHRDPNFKQALIEVRSCQCCMPLPPKMTLLLALCALEPTVLVVSAVISRLKYATAPYFGRLLSYAMVILQYSLACLSPCAATMQAYGCKDPQQPDTLFCMGLGKFVPKQLVCGAHLFKYSWRNEVAQVLGFTNINDPANGLLLIK